MYFFPDYENFLKIKYLGIDFFFYSLAESFPSFSNSILFLIKYRKK